MSEAFYIAMHAHVIAATLNAGKPEFWFFSLNALVNGMLYFACAFPVLR